MVSSKTLILDHKTVDQKLVRIAHQIIENNANESNVILVGIMSNGFKVAERIHHIISETGLCSTELESLKLHKDLPLEHGMEFSGELESLEGKSVVLIDDVLNSGRTLIYATRYLLESGLKQLSTVVLVDRRHRKFPIKADFVGLTLSTTLKERIAVEFDGDKAQAFLE